jgi:spermidine synthase
MNGLKRIKSLLDFFEDDREMGVQRKYNYYNSTSHHLHTEKQEVDLLESSVWGKMLFLDGVLQSTTKDEIIYHNALVHPLMDTIQSKKNILILGGGEGATAREVLRWNDVKNVTMVDYDKELVDLMCLRGSEWSKGAFNDTRLRVVYDDAWKYMEQSESFDGIIIDLTDPSLKKEKWKSLLESVIKSIKPRSGGFVMNAGLYIPWKTDQLKEIKEMIEELCIANREFKYYMYTAMIPSFNGEWTFIVVSNIKRFMIEPTDLSIIPYWIRRCIKVLDPRILDELISTDPTTDAIYHKV